jgi:hypothetical protein
MRELGSRNYLPLQQSHSILMDCGAKPGNDDGRELRYNARK